MKKFLIILCLLAGSFSCFSQAEVKQTNDTVQIKRRMSGDAYLDVFGVLKVSTVSTGATTDSIVVYDPISKKLRKITRASLLNHSHTQYQVTDLGDSLKNKVTRSGFYSDPAWITTLSWSKITGSNAAQWDSAYSRRLVSLSFSSGTFTETLGSGQRLDISLDGRWLKIVDTTAMLLNRLKISDTALMMSNRLKISDTATAFSHYVNKYSDQININGDKVFNGTITASYLTALNTVTGNLGSFNTIAGTLTTAAQANITSLGTLGQLTVTNTVTAGTISGTTLRGAGTGITGLTNSNLSGSAGITNANLANSTITVGSTSISLGATTTTIAGLTALTSTTLAGTLQTASQPNVTSLGTLTNLSVTGTVAATTFSGNALTADAWRTPRSLTFTGNVTGSFSSVDGSSSLSTALTIGTGVVTNAMLAGSIDLTTKVTGVLPLGNGGLGVSSITAGYIPYGNGSSAISSSANLIFDGSALRVGNIAADGSNTLIVNGTARAVGGTLQFTAEGAVQGAVLVKKTGSSGMSMASNANSTLFFYDNAAGSYAANYSSGHWQFGGNTDNGYKVDVGGTLNATGAVTFGSTLGVTGTVTSSTGNSGTAFNSNAATTGYNIGYRVSNTGGGVGILAVEGATGGQTATGAPAYATVLSTASNTSLAFGINQVMKMEMTASQTTFSHILATAGDIYAFASKSSGYTLTGNDHYIKVTGSGTYTLPTAVGRTGQHYTIVSSYVGTITIGTTSSQTITASNASGTSLTIQVCSGIGYIEVVSDGSNWLAISYQTGSGC